MAHRKIFYDGENRKKRKEMKKKIETIVLVSFIRPTVFFLIGLEKSRIVLIAREKEKTNISKKNVTMYVPLLSLSFCRLSNLRIDRCALGLTPE